MTCSLSLSVHTPCLYLEKQEENSSTPSDRRSGQVQKDT